MSCGLRRIRNIHADRTPFPWSLERGDYRDLRHFRQFLIAAALFNYLNGPPPTHLFTGISGNTLDYTRRRMSLVQVDSSNFTRIQLVACHLLCLIISGIIIDIDGIWARRTPSASDWKHSTRMNYVDHPIDTVFRTRRN